MPINSFENYPMSWKPDLTGQEPPLYKALAKLLESDIKSGTLKPGDMLPPQRELADFLDINVSTVSRAFKYCEQKGLICATVGKGTYVSNDAHINGTLLDFLKGPDLINMGPTLPIYDTDKAIIQCMKELVQEPDAASLLQYSFPCGSDQLKESGVRWLNRVHLHTSIDHVLFANGGQNALSAILSSLFQPGDRIGTSALIYSGFKTLATMLGIKLIPIPFEGEKLSLPALRSLCKNEDLKGLYLIPDYLNPTSNIMTLEVRKEIATISKDFQLIVIEDGINSVLQDSILPPIASMAPEQTIYISSLSKCLCAGLRIAVLYAPSTYKTLLELSFYNINMMISPLIAELACNIMDSDVSDSIIQEKIRTIKQRNQLANRILAGYQLLGTETSSFRFLCLPEGLTGKSFEAFVKNAGAICYCAERFAVGNAPFPAGVRISMTAPKTIEELEVGLTILKLVLEEQEDPFTMM